MLYKFIDKYNIQRAKNPIYLGDKVISNPTEETLKELGYKELIETPMPTTEEESKYYIPTYEDGKKIKQSWELREYEIIE